MNRSTGWAIHHPAHGFMSALNVELMISDPLKVANVRGVALLDTRQTARTVMRKLEDQHVSLDGYKPVRATVRVEVIR